MKGEGVTLSPESCLVFGKLCFDRRLPEVWNLLDGHFACLDFGDVELYHILFLRLTPADADLCRRDRNVGVECFFVGIVWVY